MTDQFVVLQMRDKYLARWAMDKEHNDPVAPKAFNWHFGLINTTLRNLEKQHVAAEPKHLAALVSFAERAYRRPLTANERSDLLAYYKKLRTESAAQPRRRGARHHCQRADVAGLPLSLRSGDGEKRRRFIGQARSLKQGQAFAAQPLSDYSLASRLSYFLWASMPDAELLRHAAAGDLHKPAVLLAETHRMLKDPKVKGLATEFTGNWLVFRQFETNNSVDRERFPTFNDDLREAMFQEPIRFMQDNIAERAFGAGSALWQLHLRQSAAGPALRHAGGAMATTTIGCKVDNADKYGRGGILPMAVFMTEYSPGLRTSPVKRGNWVVQKVLGIRVPPPPPVVPELPSDESKTDLPIREMLAAAPQESVLRRMPCALRFLRSGL